MVAIGTFEWISFRIINKMPKHDIFVGVLVAIITILLHNGIGRLNRSDHFSFGFAWESAKRIRARKYIDEKGKALRNIRAIIFWFYYFPKNLM
jgi:SulP family sulfate permease